jgi:hypothetical protein
LGRLAGNAVIETVSIHSSSPSSICGFS